MFYIGVQILDPSMPYISGRREYETKFRMEGAGDKVVEVNLGSRTSFF
jgi:hypothetical protein